MWAGVGRTKGGEAVEKVVVRWMSYIACGVMLTVEVICMLQAKGGEQPL